LGNEDKPVRMFTN